MAANMCWSFHYGNRDDYDLADRWDSKPVYMNPHEVVAKHKEIYANTKKQMAEHPEYFIDTVWFGREVNDVETLMEFFNPNSSHLIWMDKYRGEWFSCREIKW